MLAVAPARLFFGLVLALGLLELDPGLLHWSVAAALLKLVPKPLETPRSLGLARLPALTGPILPQLVRDVVDGARRPGLAACSSSPSRDERPCSRLPWPSSLTGRARRLCRTHRGRVHGLSALATQQQP